MGVTRWFTVSDVARMLKVHDETVRRWLRAGKLGGINPGGMFGWRISERDLETFIAMRLQQEASRKSPTFQRTQ